MAERQNKGGRLEEDHRERDVTHLARQNVGRKRRLRKGWHDQSWGRKRLMAATSSGGKRGGKGGGEQWVGRPLLYREKGWEEQYGSMLRVVLAAQGAARPGPGPQAQVPRHGQDTQLRAGGKAGVRRGGKPGGMAQAKQQHGQRRKTVKEKEKREKEKMRKRNEKGRKKGKKRKVQENSNFEF